MGCIQGHFLQITLPAEPQSYVEKSYLLDVQVLLQRFTTYKAQIRRDIKLAEVEAIKAKKLEKKRKEMEKVKKENPGLEIDEELFLGMYLITHTYLFIVV